MKYLKNPLGLLLLVMILLNAGMEAVAADDLFIGFDNQDKLRLTDMNITAWKSNQRGGDKARILLSKKDSKEAHTLIDLDAYTPGQRYDHLILRIFVHGDYHPKQVGTVQITVSSDGVKYHPVKLTAKRQGKFDGGWFGYQLRSSNALEKFRYVKLQICDIPVAWRLELADLFLGDGHLPEIPQKTDIQADQAPQTNSSLLPDGQVSNVPIPSYPITTAQAGPCATTVHDLLICPLDPDDEKLQNEALSRYPWTASRINESDFRTHTWNNHPNLKIPAQTQTVLYRFQVDLKDWPGHGQLLLELDQCAFVTTLWVDGKQGPTIREGLLPIAFDLTPFITPAKKKLDLVLYVQDYRKQIDQARNYPTMPLGAMFKWTKGVVIPPRVTWQSEIHSEKPFVFSDILNNQLTAQTTITNDSPKAQTGTLVRKIISSDGIDIFAHQQTFDIPANQAKELSHTFTVNGELKLWDIGKPNLYFAIDEIHIAGKIVDQRRTRFGYRTITVEGEDIHLNGRKIQLIGPWAHIGEWCWAPVKDYDIYEAFGLMLKHGLNYGRLHGQPFPSYFYNAADETGFLLVAESGLFHRPIADISLNHVRNMAMTLRNHPSVIAWSGSNEFEHWITPRPEPTMDFLVKVHDTFKSVDPTRPVQHSGFGDAHNHFDIYNIHYPELMRTYPQGLLWKTYAPQRIKTLYRHNFTSFNPVGRKPIFVGEQMTPGRKRGMEAIYGEAHLKLSYQNDRKAYEQLLKNQGDVWADMVRVYRQQNIAMLSPNMMYLKPSIESPFLIALGKELRGVSCYINERDPIITTGSPQQRTLVMRDTDGYLDAGKVRITLTAEKQMLFAQAMDITLKSSETRTQLLSMNLPAVDHPTLATLTVSFTDQGQDDPRYQWENQIKLYPPTQQRVSLSEPVIVWATDRQANEVLTNLGARTQVIDTLPITLNAKVLLIDSSVDHSTLAASAKQLETHVLAGGQVLLLPRKRIPDGLLPVTCQAVDDTSSGLEGASIGFVLAAFHPVFTDANIDTLDLRYWGLDDELISPQALYKPTQGNFQVLVDANEKLDDVLLMQINHGKGRYMVCQLDLIQHAAHHPAAAKMLAALLSNLDQAGDTSTLPGYYLPDTETFTAHLLERMGWHKLETSSKLKVHALLIDAQAIEKMDANQLAEYASQADILIFKHLTTEQSQMVIKQLNLPKLDAKAGEKPQPQSKRRSNDEAVYLTAYPALLDGLNTCDANWYQRLRPALTVYKANDHWQSPLSTGTIAVHQSATQTVVFDTSPWNQEVDLLDQRDRFISTLWTNLGITVKGTNVQRRSSENHYTHLDLSSLCNTSIKQYLGPNIPRGTVELNNIPFRILAMTPQQKQTMLRFNARVGSELEDQTVMFDTAIDQFEVKTPTSVSLPIARAHASHLYFAHASTQNWKIKPHNIGSVVYRVDVEYDNGTTQQIPMLMNRDIDDCRSASAQSRNSQVGLRVKNPNNGHGEVATIYVSSWTNPYPERKITQITITSGINPPYDAMVFGITMRQADEAYE
jgi:hypothetical protein